MADNRCIRISDLKQKIRYQPMVGTYVSEEDIDLAERVFCKCGEAAKISEYSIAYTQIYRNGVVAFAKYLKDHSFLCDSNDWHSFQAIDVENDLDDFVEDFLRGN